MSHNNDEDYFEDSHIGFMEQMLMSDDEDEDDDYASNLHDVVTQREENNKVT